MKCDVMIIGAGAAGLMCAATAARRGRKVVLLEHSRQIGQKILVSGGGRCNFTNLHISADNYISGNYDFVRSAISKFGLADIVALLDRYHISYYEKKDGQLFCRQPAKVILSALRKECESNGVEIVKGVEIKNVTKGERFTIAGRECASLVVATGGLSYKKLGATDLGHRLARQFGLKVTECRPGLVPLVLAAADQKMLAGLSGVSFEATVSCGKQAFKDSVLITHRGLSGPAVLQISSYWKKGDTIDLSLEGENIPKRLEKALCGRSGLSIVPKSTEGYDHAEVTVGGVDVNELSSQTLESKKVNGLYFIGEVLDVTGQLGGYNLHWAWASGFTAGGYV